MSSSPHRSVRTPAQLRERGLIGADELIAVERVVARFAASITDDLVELIDLDDLDDPIAAQFVPRARELDIQPEELRDPIGDAALGRVHQGGPGCGGPEEPRHVGERDEQQHHPAGEVGGQGPLGHRCRRCGAGDRARHRARLRSTTMSEGAAPTLGCRLLTASHPWRPRSSSRRSISSWSNPFQPSP
ncbi:MAG TPA: hypothetical protein VK034_27490, partial [Enhygromyxa sp.]|nr:hypothetical protein [Enhygromyxa sp.]